MQHQDGAQRFWEIADELAASGEVVIDHPKGSQHPRNPEIIFPLDYGYLRDTQAMDGSGIDVWLGSLPNRRVMGVVVTADIFKRDAEVKLLVGCTRDEAELALATHNTRWQAGFLVWRSPAPGQVPGRFA